MSSESGQISLGETPSAPYLSIREHFFESSACDHLKPPLILHQPHHESIVGAWIANAPKVEKLSEEIVQLLHFVAFDIYQSHNCNLQPVPFV
jgi:hypothetical protein